MAKNVTGKNIYDMLSNQTSNVIRKLVDNDIKIKSANISIEPCTRL